MPPTALSYVYCTEANIQAFLSVDGETGRLDDDNDGSVNSTEQGYLTQAINWATDRVNFFLLSRYDAKDLATSWLVNNWCVIIACQWLSSRRGNPPPGSFSDLYEETIEDMKLVRSGGAQVPMVALRTSAWPAWSNVRVDMLYALRKVRVERPISEQTAKLGYAQAQDIAANFIIEP